MQVLLTDVELCCRRRSSAAGEHFQRHRRVVSCACGLLQQLQCHGDAGRTLQNVFSIPIFSRSRVEVSVSVPKAREFSSQISVRSDVCSFGAWRRDHITPILRQLHWLHACDNKVKALSWFSSVCPTMHRRNCQTSVSSSLTSACADSARPTRQCVLFDGHTTPSVIDVSLRFKLRQRDTL